MNNQTLLIRTEQIEQVILLIRPQRVMLDRHLAALYGVETRNLNKAAAPSSSKTAPTSNCALSTVARLLTCPPAQYRRSNQRPLLHESRFT